MEVVISKYFWKLPVLKLQKSWKYKDRLLSSLAFARGASVYIYKGKGEAMNEFELADGLWEVESEETASDTPSSEPSSEPPAKQLKVCAHGNVQRASCRACQDEVKCVHDQIFYTCRECNVHGKGYFCFHGKARSQCKDCGGGGICRHGRQRCQCKDCGGSSICEHGRQRSQCKDCGGSSICEHGRVRSKCKDCGGGSICEHGRVRYNCLPCGGKGALKREAEKECVKRWVRDSHLREKMLPTVAAEQGGKCAGFWTCEEVEGGKPVNLCPWGDRPVPEWAQQLDHIVPHAQTQDDSRENLQMLCACCHAGKTAAERGAKSVGQTTE